MRLESTYKLLTEEFCKAEATTVLKGGILSLRKVSAGTNFTLARRNILTFVEDHSGIVLVCWQRVTQRKPFRTLA